MNVRDETRHDLHKSAALLWRSFSHNRTKINIQFINIENIQKELKWKPYTTLNVPYPSLFVVETFPNMNLNAVRA